MLEIEFENPVEHTYTLTSFLQICKQATSFLLTPVLFILSSGTPFQSKAEILFTNLFFAYVSHMSDFNASLTSVFQDDLKLRERIDDD